MRVEELAGLRAELEGFAEGVFEGFARSDQRATGLRYLRGLMLEGQRKSMQPMAERLGVDHQQLQQFMTSSTWDYVSVRRRVAARMIDLIEPVAWVIDDTGFVKDGDASPGVTRQYSGTLGKVGNCQVAVSVHAATTKASGMLDCRLYLPKVWDAAQLPAPVGEDVVAAAAAGAAARAAARRKIVQAMARAKKVSSSLANAAAQVGITQGEHDRMSALIEVRRARARIPDEVIYQAKWQLALDMIDELIGWGHIPPVIVADAGYSQGELRAALAERALTYMLAVQPTLTAHGHDAVLIPATGRAHATYESAAENVKNVALQAGRSAFRKVTWRNGTRHTPDNPGAAMSSHFHAVRVRPAAKSNPRTDDGHAPEVWLLIEWPPDASEPTDYWLSNLPARTSLKTLVTTAKMRWRIEHDYRELKTGLGLDHFEGRSYPGFNRHVTLVAAAQLFITTLRLTHPKAPGQS
jgi:SRSO17 transposase